MDTLYRKYNLDVKPENYSYNTIIHTDLIIQAIDLQWWIDTGGGANDVTQDAWAKGVTRLGDFFWRDKWPDYFSTSYKQQDNIYK